MFCVYITIYSGKDLPPFYIGSTSVDKLTSGYVGSVQSKKYGLVWKEEIKNHPELFDTIILETCDTRECALERELYWQVRCDVVKSENFCNMSLARKNGFFGMDVSGRKHRPESIQKIRDNHYWKGKSRPEHSKILSGRSRPDQSIAMAGENNPMFGKTHPNKGKSLNITMATCPKCGATSRRSAIVRYHGIDGEKCSKN